MLLWLWCRLAAVALIQPLAWEIPYAVGVALKRKKKNACLRKLSSFTSIEPKVLKEVTFPSTKPD